MPVLDVPEDYEPPPSAAPDPIRGSVPQGKIILNDALAPLGDLVEEADAQYPARAPLPDGRE